MCSHIPNSHSQSTQNASQSQVFVYLDSKNRTSGSLSTSNFSYQFNWPKNKSYKYVSLISAQFQKGYYTIDSTNNTFTVVETTGANTFTCSLTSGRNYTVSQFVAELKTQLDADNGSAQVYTVSYSSTTGFITIANDTGEFTIDCDGNASMAQYLGINCNGTAVASSGQAITSTRVVNMQRYSNLYIRSSICRNGLNDILGCLDVKDTADFDMYQLTDLQYKWREAVNADSMMHNFSLTDIDGNGIDLNGCDIQLSFLLSQ